MKVLVSVIAIVITLALTVFLSINKRFKEIDLD